MTKIQQNFQTVFVGKLVENPFLLLASVESWVVVISAMANFLAPSVANLIPVIQVLIGASAFALSLFVAVKTVFPQAKFEWKYMHFRSAGVEEQWRHELLLMNVGRRASVAPHVVIDAPTRILDYQVDTLSGNEAFKRIDARDRTNRLEFEAISMGPGVKLKIEIWTNTSDLVKARAHGTETPQAEAIVKADDYPVRLTNVPLSLIVTIVAAVLGAVVLIVMRLR